MEQPLYNTPISRHITHMYVNINTKHPNAVYNIGKQLVVHGNHVHM